MIKVTKDLKHTLQTNKHIENVYFDKFGNHFLQAHAHTITGVLYHKIKDQTVTVTKDVNGKSAQKKEKVYEAHPDHELVDTLSASDVLKYPIDAAPEFQDRDAAKIYEDQAQESAKLRAELEELKNKSAETTAKSNEDEATLEQLKAELAKANEEKEAYAQMLAEKEEADKLAKAAKENQNAAPKKDK
jgi:hypothetical protein